MNAASACALLAIVLSACTTYGTSDAERMSSYDLCASQVNHAWGLSEATRHLLARELERRKENCAAHAAGIRAGRDEDLYDRMYRNQSP